MFNDCLDLEIETVNGKSHCLICRDKTVQYLKNKIISNQEFDTSKEYVLFGSIKDKHTTLLNDQAILGDLENFDRILFTESCKGSECQA